MLVGSQAHGVCSNINMAKSIRSKAKRKLRAAKREKIAAKERLKVLAIQEQEEGIKMSQDTVESSEKDENIPASSGVPGGAANLTVFAQYPCGKLHSPKEYSGGMKCNIHYADGGDGDETMEVVSENQSVVKAKKKKLKKTSKSVNGKNIKRLKKKRKNKYKW